MPFLFSLSSGIPLPSFQEKKIEKLFSQRRIETNQE
jgi:hypothetical protein